MTDRDDAPAPGPGEAGPPEPAPPPRPPAPAPLVAWEAPRPTAGPRGSLPAPGAGYAGGPPPFTIGGLLADCFAIYAADPLRFIAVSIITSVVGFLGSFASNPFDPASPAGGPAGLLGVLGFVLGIIGGAVILALADAGPGLAFDRVIRRGVERSGWLFLTSLLIGIGAIVILIVPIVVIVIAALTSPTLALVLMLVLMAALVWIGVRVALAVPATVVDNLNSIDAIRLAWRITSPAGVWARILGAGLLLSLMFVPAFAGLGIAAAVSSLAGQPALLLAFSMGLALFTPVASLLTYAAYRRLVAPIGPWWVERAATAPAPPVDTGPPSIETLPPRAVDAGIASPDTAPSSIESAPPVTAAPPADQRPIFRARPFGGFARALLAALLVADLLGVVAAGWAIGELAAGHIRLPTFPGYPGPRFGGASGDVVDPGTVAFGTTAELDTCTVTGEGLVFDSSTPLVWMAAFPERITPADEVFLHVTVGGREVETTLQDPGTYDCLGVEVASPFDAGIYGFEVIVNGSVEANGTVFVQ